MSRDSSSSVIRDVWAGASSATIFSPSIPPKELLALFRSPYPPSASHTAQIPDIIASIDGEIKHCDAQLRRLRSELASLENQREWAKKQQKKYKSLLAPVRRMPTELLDYIFTLFGSMNPNCITVPNTDLPGFVLMSVCARWRVLAQSCTGLWSNISLKLGCVDRGAAYYESLRLPLKWCFDHTGDIHPLDIAFEGVMSGEDSEEDVEEPAVVKMLTAQASRWRHVSFETEYYLDDFPSLAQLVDKHMPLLESVRSINNGPPTDEILRLFRHAPDLRELVLKCSSPQELEVPSAMTQIRSLVLHPRTGVSGLFRLLPAFTTLQSLSYNLPYTFVHVESRLPSQSSASVSSLNITVQPVTLALHSDGLRELLNSACLPSLKQLSMRFSSEDEQYDDIESINTVWPVDVRAFLLRSKCSLTTLKLEDAITSDEEMISLLVQTPELQHLVLHQNTPRKLSEKEMNNIPKALRETSLTLAFIERLHAFRAGEDLGNALVPKLQTLSLRALGSWFKDDRLLCDVARSRWIPDQTLATKVGIECLKSVRVEILGRKPDLEIYESLNELGMKVEVFGEKSP